MNYAIDGVNKMQRYKITLVRETNGSWNVAGYWEHSNRDKGINSNDYFWGRDGDWVNFKTKAEALAYISKQRGVPE